MSKRRTTIEIYKGRGPKPFRWREKAGNGEIIAQGQGYTRRHDAIRGGVRAVGCVSWLRKRVIFVNC